MRIAASIPWNYADEHGLKPKEITERLMGIFLSIGHDLGHGFLESVYEQAFSGVLAENKIFFERQIAIPVWFRRVQIGKFRADWLAERYDKKNPRNPRESAEKKLPGRCG